MSNRRYMLKIINGKIVYVEENSNGSIIKKFDNTTYGSGIAFIKDVTGIKLDKEPTYEEIVEILNKIQD
jgi:hypothetical protein